MKPIVTVFIILLLSSFAFSQDAYMPADDNEVAEIMIYPNPITDGKFYVRTDKIIRSVEVLNVIGQSIKTVRNDTNQPYNIKVGLPKCKKGMYLVRIIMEDKASYIKKILIK
ncbi:MAG: T9SS type A sorting domain-containing protein [Bacteroidota bacterium]|nr:T9SS type A sorting domain-containing protein [Bacteroidota bacterium]